MEVTPMDDNASSIQPSPAPQRTGIDAKHTLKSGLNTHKARPFNNSNVIMWYTEETTLNDRYVSFFYYITHNSLTLVRFRKHFSDSKLKSKILCTIVFVIYTCVIMTIGILVVYFNTLKQPGIFLQRLIASYGNHDDLIYCFYCDILFRPKLWYEVCKNGQKSNRI